MAPDNRELMSIRRVVNPKRYPIIIMPGNASDLEQCPFSNNGFAYPGHSRK